MHPDHASRTYRRLSRAGFGAALLLAGLFAGGQPGPARASAVAPPHFGCATRVARGLPPCPSLSAGLTGARQRVARDRHDPAAFKAAVDAAIAGGERIWFRGDGTGSGANAPFTTAPGRQLSTVRSTRDDFSSCPTFSDLQTSIQSAAVVTIESAAACTVVFPNSIAIDHDLSISAATSTGTVTFDAQGQTPFFTVQPNVTMTLDTLGLTGGYVDGSPGGAITNDGTLLLTNSAITHSSAACGGGCSALGGAVENTAGATLTVQNSVIQYNSASCDDSLCPLVGGGGIWNDGGKVTITASFIDDNTIGCSNACSTMRGAGYGQNGGTLNLTNSTISDNDACGAGGCGAGEGAGIDVNGGTATLQAATIAFNGSDLGAGGLEVHSGSTVTLADSLLDENSAGGEPADCAAAAGTLADGTGGYNLFGSGTGCDAIVPNQNGDAFGMDSRLDPSGWDYNGGPTPTIALLPTSPAIGFTPVASGACPAADQRGAARPANGACDAGAYQSITQDLGCPAQESDLANPIGALTEREILRMSCVSPADIHFGDAGQGGSGAITVNTPVDLYVPPSSAPISLDGDGKSGLLQFGNLAASALGLTFTDGSAAYGGALSSDGGLTLERDTFTGNTATNGGGAVDSDGCLTVGHSTFSANSALYGGGIAVESGCLTVDGSTFTTNLQSDNTDGGAIDAVGLVSIDRSTFTDNMVGAGGFGGAVALELGIMAIEDSAFSANSAGPGGAGGAVVNGDTTEIVNSTFSGNAVNGGGGGALANGGGLLVAFSTFTHNDAGSTGDGGALYDVSGDSQFAGSILAANTPDNCAASSNSDQYNIESGTDCGLTDPTDQQNTDPLLGPLANWGGPTETIPLLPGSPAIGDIPTGVGTTFCPFTDQRDYDRHATSCDAGAFETGARPDTADLPASGPGITNIFHNTDPAGTNSDTLTVEGNNFSPAAAIELDGVATQPTTFVSSSELQMPLQTTDLAMSGVREVTVVDGGQTSNALPFYLTPSAASVASFTSGNMTATTGGTGPGTPGSLTAATNTSGPIQLAAFTASPTSGSSSGRVDFFDLHLAHSIATTQVTLTDCTPGLSSFQWRPSGATGWQYVTPASAVTMVNGCLQVTLTSASSASPTSPAVEDLNGTIFAGSTTTTRALVAGTRVTRHGREHILHWRMANQAGVLGFRLTGHGVPLTPRLIPVHAARTYRYATTQAGPYLLNVLLRNGSAQRVRLR